MKKKMIMAFVVMGSAAGAMAKVQYSITSKTEAEIKRLAGANVAHAYVDKKVGQAKNILNLEVYIESAVVEIMPSKWQLFSKPKSVDVAPKIKHMLHVMGGKESRLTLHGDFDKTLGNPDPADKKSPRQFSMTAYVKRTPYPSRGSSSNNIREVKITVPNNPSKPFVWHPADAFANELGKDEEWDMAD